MSETKYRIPKLAVAVMVLGGCGDDGDGGGGQSTDERFGEVAKDSCKLVFTCQAGPWTPDPTEDVSFETEQECVTQFTRQVKSEFATASEKCRDAFLDYYECYIDAGCDGDLAGKCQASYQRYQDACADEL